MVLLALTLHALQEERRPRIKVIEYTHSQYRPPPEPVTPTPDAEPGARWIPIPLFSFLDHEGGSYGAAAVIAPEIDAGRMVTYYLPSLFWNPDTRFNISLVGAQRLGDDESLRFAAHVATRRNRGFSLDYANHDLDGVDAFDGIDASLEHAVEGRWFFRGFGNDVENTPVANYAEEVWAGHVHGLWRPGDGRETTLYGGPGFDDRTIHNGIYDLTSSVRRIKDLFPGAPGIRTGSGYAGVKFGVRYDSRDAVLLPRSGTFVDVFGAYHAKVRGAGPDGYPHFGIDARRYFDFDEDTVLAARFAFEGVSRDGDLPFTRRPALGGLSDLRAFGADHYRDFFALSASVELRIRLWSFTAFGVPVDLEAGPLLDLGTVFNGFDDPEAFENFNANPGLHVRLVNRPNLAIELVAAYGREGAQAHFGFGWPF